jgi:hypothetical protein
MILVPQTAVFPTTITLHFKSPVFGPDLSTVTAVAAGLLRRDGTSTSLAFTIVSANTRELVAQYTFQGAGEITTTGAYFLAPTVAVQGGTIAAETVPVFVGGPYNAIPQLEQDCWLLATVPIPSAGPVRSTWVDVTSSIVASPFGPHMALDLRTTPISVTLWTAIDGDLATFTDVFNGAAGHNFTVIGAAGQTVPVGDGTFAASAVRNTNGFTLRLRFRKATNSWLVW